MDRILYDDMEQVRLSETTIPSLITQPSIKMADKSEQGQVDSSSNDGLFQQFMNEVNASFV